MTNSQGQARECPLVPGRVCDPSACKVYEGAMRAVEIADQRIVHSGVDSTDKKAMRKARTKFFKKSDHLANTQGTTGLNNCDQWNRGRR